MKKIDISGMTPVLMIANFSDRDYKVPVAVWIEKEDIENGNFILFTEFNEHIEFTGLSQKLFESLIVRAEEYNKIGFDGLMKKWKCANDELKKIRAESHEKTHEEIIKEIQKNIAEVKGNPEKAREVIMKCGLYNKNGELKDEYK